MKVSSSWVIGFGLVAATALLLSLYQLVGWSGPIWMLTAVIGFLVVYFVRSLFIVHIGELEFGVVFYHNGNFARFLDPGMRFLNPFAEHLTDRIPRGSQKANATTEVRTKEGILVKVTWAVSFKVNVHNIREAIRFKLARSLPGSADKIVAGKTIQSLRHIIEQKSVQELHRHDASKELEKQLCDQVNARLQLRHKETLSASGVAYIPERDESEPISGLGFDPIPWFDVQVYAIEMPRDIEEALEADHERRLQTKTAVTALENLQKVVEKYSDKDMERLAELERLRILDESGGSLVYLMASLAKTIRQGGNGGPPPNGPSKN